jgi:WD40 repeat protein
MREKCEIKVIDAETGKRLQTIPVSGGAFALSPVENRIACRREQMLCVLDVETGNEVTIKYGEETGHIRWTPALAFFPDGNRLAADNRVLDAVTLQEVQGTLVKTTMLYLLFSADGKYAASADAGVYAKEVLIWDCATGETLHRYAAEDSGVPCFSPDGNFLIAGNHGVVGLFELKRRGNFSDSAVAFFDVKGQEAGPACYTADGNYILAAGISRSDVSLSLYDVRQQTRLQTRTFQVPLFGDAGHVIRFSPDDSFAVSAGESLIRWDFEWEYTFPGWADWDEGARYCLKNFLALFPDWTDEDFKRKLIPDLQRRGYGWLREDGVYKELDKMNKK